MKVFYYLLNFVLIKSIYITENNSITLVNFSNKEIKWIETNDPVMGGQSTGNFSIINNTGNFQGNCKLIPYLNAPGFCKLYTKSKNNYSDISSYINKSLSILLNTKTYNYDGYFIGFKAHNVPKSSIYSSGSFKAPFSKYLKRNKDNQIVNIPFTDFSYDWSPYTGTCNTTDPTGVIHHCCSKLDNYKYCPKTEYLSSLTGFEIWAEGTEGIFDINLIWIGIFLE